MARDDPNWPRASAWLARNDPRPALEVVGVPTSSSSISHSDAWRTPPRLRAALARLATYHGEEGVDLLGLPVADRGDWDVAGLDPAGMLEAVTGLARGLGDGPVRAFLGGDNAITRPLLRGLARGELARVGLLTLDAHHDARVLDDGPLNGNPIRGLVAEDGLPGRNVAQVGIHSFANSRAYRDWCEEHGIRVATMAEVDERSVGAVVWEALDELARRCDWIYVDLDVDVLDQAYAPACPGARPGGMTPRQVARAAWLSGTHPRVAALDLVEVDADRDVGDLTLTSAATALLAFAAGVARRLGVG